MTHLGKGQNDSLVIFPEVGETFTSDDGTVSVVLADTTDPNYEPTREEIEVFAEWMGMKLPEDNEFLYIAREGLKAPLPHDWRPCRTNDDEIYYFNFRTGESTWNHPMDDFFRDKFISEKKKKNTSTSSNVTKKDTIVSSFHYSDKAFTKEETEGEKCNGAGNNISTQSNKACIMKKPLVNISGRAAGESVSASNLASAVPVLSSVPASLNERGLVDVLKQAPIKKIPSKNGSEPRIVSEAERNLEDKIRQEREATFREEEEKAEKAHEATLQEMRRNNYKEVQKVQEELAARLADVRSRFNKEQEEFIAKQRGELEKVRANINEMLQEEQTLKQQLTQLKEQHAQRVTSEVARLESATKEQHERELRRGETEMVVSLEQLKSETNAELMLKKAELQKKFQEEEQQLKHMEQKRHQEELAAIQKRHMDRVNSDGTCEGVAGGVVGNVVTIFEREKGLEEKEIAVIVQEAIKEQTALRKSFEAMLNQLREEIGDIRRDTATLLVTLDGKALDGCLAEVRCRWRAEEENYIKTLVDGRQNMLAAVEQQLLPVKLTQFSHSSVAIGSDGHFCGDLCAASDAALATRKKVLQETEAFLRVTLQKELANTCAPTDLQIAEAIKDDLTVYVRSIEAQRGFEQNEFERRHDNTFAHNEEDTMAQTTETVDTAANVEEELKGVIAVEVEKKLKAMAADVELARKKLQERYQEERRLLFMAVDKEILAYGENERRTIDAEEEAKAKQREAEMRAVLVAKAMADVEYAKKTKTKEEINVKTNTQSQQFQRVSTELLQQRLNSIEQMYIAQEQELKAELDSINIEIGKLKGSLVVDEERLLQQGAFQAFPQPKNINGSAPGVLAAAASLPVQKERHCASPFFSEALHFLSEQQRELSLRRGVLNAAREEWQNNVRNANSRVLSSPILSTSTPGAAVGSDVSLRLLTLLGSLDDRLQELSERFAELHTTSASLSPQRLEGRRRFSSGRCDRRGRRALSATGRGGSITKAAGKLSHENSTEHVSATCMEKWNKILLDLAHSCSQDDRDIAEFVQQQVTC